MKKTVLSIAILILGLVSAAAVSAQARAQITLKPSQQKNILLGGRGATQIKIRFIEVSEDSRCPENARCVWAGNAKVKIEVSSKRGGSKIIEMNTTGGPHGGQFEGYAINLDSLTPGRMTSDPIRSSRYRATISVSRLTR